MISIQKNSPWNQVQKHLQLGDHFAFFRENCLEGSQLQWMSHLLGSLNNTGRVLPLLGLAPIELPGATHQAAERLAVGTAVVTSDKDLYQTLSDQVHLALVDPYHPGRKARVNLKLEGEAYQSYPVILDEHGAGALLLSHLPTGSYQAEMVTETETGPSCSFRVAEYRLVPLVAQLVQGHAQGTAFQFTLQLESYGLAVSEEVRLSLMDQDRLCSTQQLHCQQGELRGEVELQGDGPFSLNLQLVQDPSRSATVPLTGSRAQEREMTLLSNLGRSVEASLLPSQQALEVRGLFLQEGAVRNTPLRLERVDTRRLRLVAGAPLSGLVIVLSDPTFPGLAAPACPSPHPQRSDAEYGNGYQLYRNGRWQESLDAFAEVWNRTALKGESLHPFYAYNAACCQALLGNLDGALLWLERSFRDGLKDWEMLARDDDFAALRDHPRFQHLLRAGLLVHEVGDLAAGQAVELNIEGNLALLTVGAFVEGDPWEGRALVVAPVEFCPELKVECAQELRIQILGPTQGCAYVVVKDARLLSQDHPSSRLAERIKDIARRWNMSRRREEVLPTLASLREQEEAKTQFFGPSDDPFAPQRPSGYDSAFPMSVRDPFGSAVDPFAAAVPFSAAADPFGSAVDPFAAAVPFSAAADPFAASDPFAAAVPFSAASDPFAAAADPFAPAAPEAAPPTTRGTTPPAEAAAPAQPPQVLFAGWIPLVEGHLSLQLELPEHPLTLQVEALVLAQRDWKRLETRCQVQADPCIDLQLPPFCYPGDRIWGQLLVRSAKRSLSVKLFHDGVECPLEPLSSDSWKFEIRPGSYECEVSDLDSNLSWRRRGSVEAPGKLITLCRSPQILQAGEGLSKVTDPDILGFRLLPTLDEPFKLCLQATADYAHSCCEQTAAKLVAACALWVFGSGDQQIRAESIIKAGIRRLETMWLRGKGFKTYPESPSVRDTYWGPKAARYLWVLNSLQNSPQLAEDAAAGLRMAQDTSWAYGMTWPPQNIASHEDAYWALRYQPTHLQARQFLDNPVSGNHLSARIEKAYQAAAMVWCGHDLKRALGLANEVTSALNSEGRLYSTADSVAAIALLMTLKQRGIGQAPAQVEVGPDGVKVQQGLAIVEVDRWREDDWFALKSSVPLSVVLRKAGNPSWRCRPGDSLELVVSLEAGYTSGDLLWVCLPEGLSRVVGGGQVKLFSVDFRGQTEVRVPLAVTTRHAGDQSFAVCVRNMYDEQRAGNPGLLTVSIGP